MRMLLQWRVARKRALLAAISQLSASLASRHKVQCLAHGCRPCRRRHRAARCAVHVCLHECHVGSTNAMWGGLARLCSGAALQKCSA